MNFSTRKKIKILFCKRKSNGQQKKNVTTYNFFYLAITLYFNDFFE